MTSGVATSLIVLDIIVTSLTQEWDIVWLAFTPILVEGIVLIYAMQKIQAEID